MCRILWLTFLAHPVDYSRAAVTDTDQQTTIGIRASMKFTGRFLRPCQDGNDGLPICVGDGGHVPPKFGKIFFGQLLCKTWAFLPCDAMRCTFLVIVILSVRLSVRPSVCPSVCHTRALCPHGSTYDHDFFTIW